MPSLAAEPPPNVKPLKAEIRALEKKYKNVMAEIEDEDDGTLRRDLRRRANELCRALDKKGVELRKLIPLNGRPIKPLDEAKMLGHLEDIRGLLNQETPAAADAIRKLTGPIRIKQGAPKKDDRRGGATWIAVFQPKLVEMLTRMAREKNCPDSLVLEYLLGAIWTTSETVDVPIDFAPKHERFAAEVLADQRAGVLQANTCRKYKLTTVEYQAALHFALFGQRPRPKKPPAKQHRNPENKGKRHNTKYKVLVPNVVRLRDEEHLSFREIARRSGVCVKTVLRAYEEAHPEIVQRAIVEGGPIVHDP